MLIGNLLITEPTNVHCDREIYFHTEKRAFCIGFIKCDFNRDKQRYVYQVLFTFGYELCFKEKPNFRSREFESVPSAISYIKQKIAEARF